MRGSSSHDPTRRTLLSCCWCSLCSVTPHYPYSMYIQGTVQYNSSCTYCVRTKQPYSTSVSVSSYFANELRALMRIGLHCTALHCTAPQLSAAHVNSASSLCIGLHRWSFCIRIRSAVRIRWAPRVGPSHPNPHGKVGIFSLIVFPIPLGLSWSRLIGLHRARMEIFSQSPSLNWISFGFFISFFFTSAFNLDPSRGFLRWAGQFWPAVDPFPPFSGLAHFIARSDSHPPFGTWVHIGFLIESANFHRKSFRLDAAYGTFLGSWPCSTVAVA